MKYPVPFALALASVASAQLSHDAAFDVRGGPQELFALQVSVVGDVDGDGCADVAVHAEASNDGLVRLHSGRDGAFLRELPPVGVELFTRMVAGVGDLDRDGLGDLVVGDGQNSVARVYSGGTGKLLFQSHGASQDGFGDGFGAAVGSAGDVNADGVPDVVVGAAERFGRGGEYALVLSGIDGTKIHTLRPYPGVRARGPERFGASVAGAGDVNRDGFDDVVVGAPLGGRYVRHPFFPHIWTSDASGAVRVFSGADGALLYTIYGDRQWLGLGYSVAGLGDVNADGYDDFAAGTTNTEEPWLPGYARVISGRDGATLQTLLESEPTPPRFVSVATAGDLDRDGRPDVLVGTDRFACVFSGTTGEELLRFHLDSPAPSFLYSVGGGHDMNRDGTMDFAVTAPVAAVGAGFVRVFHSQPPLRAKR